MSIVRHLSRTCLAALALLPLIGNANAQVLPLHGQLEYLATLDNWPTLTIKAANGSAAYTLTLEPMRDIKNNLTGIDVAMRRPGAAPETHNLLEPPYRWHGYQEYMFAASEFKDGPNGSTFGTTRNLLVKNRKLDLKFRVVEVETKPVDAPPVPGSYVFDKLILDVEITNAK